MWNSSTSLSSQDGVGTGSGNLTPRQVSRNQAHNSRITPPHPPRRSSSRGAPPEEDTASNASRMRRVSVQTSDQKVDEAMDTLELRHALAKREATLLRKDGEIFVLSAQVQQLRKQLRKAAQEASGFASQLAQALHIGESGGRALKTDKAKALVLGAQRGLSRLANIHDAGTSRNPVGGGGLPRPVSAIGDMSNDISASAPVSTVPSAVAVGHAIEAQGAEEPPSPAPSTTPPLAPPSTPPLMGNPPGSRRDERKLSRSPKATSDSLEKERAKRLEAEAQAKAQASTLDAAERRCRGLEAERDRAAADASEIRRHASEMRQLHADQVQRLTAELHRLGGGGAAAAAIVGTSANTTVHGNSDVAELAHAGEKAGDTSENEVAPGSTHYNLQRELLRRVLRKCAMLEDELANLRDDVTRRNVVIHNLRQEVQQHQLQVSSQNEQFQQQQQQQQMLEEQQQQHQQSQQLQQLHELQELQRILEQQQQQLNQQKQRNSNDHQQNHQQNHHNQDHHYQHPLTEFSASASTVRHQEEVVGEH
eukprot:TRINITY_DN61744_c0_g1_i1.p1 TRINITY_DN61744_c0_g1~~TRINITY_DN61744_c0_g1_i1.p1  ORF type:complete len:536 (+),score=134.00 TRINITY_DN61744_c0_g1_i1:106-1713(+)